MAPGLGRDDVGAVGGQSVFYQHRCRKSLPPDAPGILRDQGASPVRKDVEARGAGPSVRLVTAK